MSQAPAIVVVTGGAGYLGRFIVRELLAEHAINVAEVRVFDLDPFEGLEPSDAADPRLRPIRGDILDDDALRTAFRDADAVIHAAALVDWGREPESRLEAVNLIGTERVIEACRAENVGVLVHTSTLDVVYTGRPIIDGDEGLPYAERPANGYCRTKLAAEQRVLEASGAALAEGGRLRTAVIRPASILGEGDRFHIGTCIDMARRRALVRIGDGTARSSFVYAGNVAHAHVLAVAALLAGNEDADGEPFFVTDREPQNFFAAMTPFVEAAGYRMPSGRFRLPRRPLLVVGALLEGTSWLIRPVARFRPTLTRFAVNFVCLDFTVVSDKAADILGYAPRYSREEADRRTLAWSREYGAGPADTRPSGSGTAQE